MISLVNSGFRPAIPQRLLVRDGAPFSPSIPASPIPLPSFSPSAPVGPALPGFSATAPVTPSVPAPQGPVDVLPDPGNPVARFLSAPITGALILADLAQALFHPIKTIKSLWSLGTRLRSFDAMTPLVAASGPAARDTLHASVADFEATGLTHVLPFLAKSIDKRAATAFGQLRPAVESTLGGRVNHVVTLTWPASGRNWTALDDTIAIGDVLKQYPDAAVQKAFNGVVEVQVQDQSVQGFFRPVRRVGNTLIVSRPLALLPGQKTIAEGLMAYLNEAGRVSTNF